MPTRSLRLPRPVRLSRSATLGLCAVPVVALLLVALLVPLPFTVARPGPTANVLGDRDGQQVVDISGAPVRETEGELRMAAIAATAPDVRHGLGDLLDGWFRTDRTVMPTDAVYPGGGSVREAERHNLREMEKSQHTAVDAALAYLKRDPERVKVTLDLAGIGGPSAGLPLALGIVDKLDGDGGGGELTGGRSVAATGTIAADGTVGPISGAALKAQAVARDGARVFLVPESNCAEARAELPRGLRLVPVGTLDGAVEALRALKDGGRVARC
ncbi:S16 family serine protease [Streptomyces sp. NPDC054796]